MAQPGFDRPETGSPDMPPKASVERARQGENIKGMMWVLVIGIGLIAVAFMILLALQHSPVTPDNKPAEINALTTSPGGPAPATLETAQSPS